MTELEENSRQLATEECVSPKNDESVAPADPSSETTVIKTTCPKSRGEGYQTLKFAHSQFDVLNVEVASLCPVDKMRIDRLVSELNKCRESKKEIELRLSVSKSENKAMQKILESCRRTHGGDKTNLTSKLSMESRKLKELTTNTSYSLDTLADQISGWELETALIRDTVDELLGHKIHLQKEVNRMEINMMVLRAEESRKKDTLEMKKLNFTKHKLKSDMMIILTSDRGCQTEEIALP